MKGSVWLRAGIGALLIATGIAARGRAQALRSPAATLVGVVRDTAGAPMVAVRLMTGAILAVTDSSGHFVITGLAAGPTTVAVRRLGFEPIDLSVQLAMGHTDSINVVMSVLAVDLPGVTTRAEALAAVRLRDFYRHRQSGIGYFFDRAQIEEKRAQRISDILRVLPGTRILPERGGRSAMRMGRNMGGRDCPPDIWVDGVRAAGMNVDDVPLGDVEALELYRGPAGLPPEMNSRLGNPSCGALIIWTRLPGPRS